MSRLGSIRNYYDSTHWAICVKLFVAPWDRKIVVFYPDNIWESSAKKVVRAIRSSTALFKCYIASRDETKTDEKRRRVARGWSGVLVALLFSRSLALEFPGSIAIWQSYSTTLLLSGSLTFQLSGSLAQSLSGCVASRPSASQALWPGFRFRVGFCFYGSAELEGGQLRHSLAF